MVAYRYAILYCPLFLRDFKILVDAAADWLLHNRIKIFPGLSDNDAILAEFDINPYSEKSQRPKVNVKIKHKYTTNELWENFKSALELGVKKIVPVKTIRKNDKLPWVSKKIKQKIKQRNQAFSKMKKSNSTEDTDKFHELKSTV